tara:strand:- start:20 stop:418 length:399 start_codon:yes stop_codon:yes gene_type:complete
MLKGKFEGQYRNANGTLVFKYGISGKSDSVEAYEGSKGDYLRHSDQSGSPLFFTTRYTGDNIKLTVTSEGEWIVDTSDIDKMTSLAEQNPMLKEAIANRLLDDILKTNSTVPASQPEVVSAAKGGEGDVSDL